MGKGDEDTRVIATTFVCRAKGFFPRSVNELQRRAGMPGCGWKR